MDKLIIMKGYQDQDRLRHSFNELAEKTFQLNFEDWYQNGFWGDCYIPYSIVADGRVVSNVSVNQMEFDCNGKRRNFIQLGTVMTEEAYRHRGLICRLMEEIEKDYMGKTEGFYLFANDSVLDFYSKFGYRKAPEYQHTKRIQAREGKSVVTVPMDSQADWRKLEHAIESSVCGSSFEMKNNNGLYLFYATKFMRECVYYIENQNAHAIAEIEDGQLLLHAVFAEKAVDLDGIAAAFGNEINGVKLGFTPLKNDSFEVGKITGPDTTLFIKGGSFDDLIGNAVMFPTLSHA